MNKKILRKEYALSIALIFLICSCNKESQTTDVQHAIRNVLDDQVKAWNKGDLDKFMEGYWKSDSLQFIGSEIATGWKGTLERYKKSYPDHDAMGSLRFELLRFNIISSDACMLTGKFFLTRKNDEPHGIFTLLFRKFDGKWVIVYDHTSQTPDKP